MPRSTSFLLGMMTGAAILAAGLHLGGGSVLPERVAAAQSGEIPAEESIRTRRLEIVDALGTVVLVAGAPDEGGSLSIRDELGRPLALIGGTSDGSALVLRNKSTQQVGLIARAGADHGGRLDLLDPVGLGTARLASDGGGSVLELGRARGDGGWSVATRPEGTGALRFESAGGPLAAMTADPAEGGTITTGTAAGEPRVELGATSAGHGRVSTFATGGDRLVTLTSSRNAEGQIYTFDGTGRMLTALATTEAGPTIRLFNVTGEPIVAVEANESGAGEIGLWAADGQGRRLGP